MVVRSKISIQVSFYGFSNINSIFLGDTSAKAEKLEEFFLLFVARFNVVVNEYDEPPSDEPTTSKRARADGNGDRDIVGKAQRKKYRKKTKAPAIPHPSTLCV